MNSHNREAMGRTIQGSVMTHFGIILGPLMILLEWIVLSVSVIIRRDQGERHLSMFMLVVNTVLMLSVVVFWTGFSAFGVFAILSLCFAIYRRWKLWSLVRSGGRWHSRCEGLPLPFFFKLPFCDNPFNIFRFYEPAFVFIIAVIITPFDYYLGFYLQVCAVSMAVIGHLQYRHQYNKRLDMNDAAIEADNMEKALDAVDPSKSKGLFNYLEGFRLPHFDGASKAEKEGIERQLRRELAGVNHLFVQREDADEAAELLKPDPKLTAKHEEEPPEETEEAPAEPQTLTADDILKGNT